MKMLAVILMTFISFCSFAESDQAVLLNPMPGDSKLSVTNTLNIYGKCGGSVVAVLGVVAESFNGQGDFKVDEGDIQIRNGGKDISFKYALSDFNIAHCVQTKSGARLLVGSNCSGSACGEERNYYIIDPKDGSVFPSKASKNLCDTKCANKALGAKYLK